MSCIPPKLFSYYSNKVNIYNNDCYIHIPGVVACPPPSWIYIGPQIVYPPSGYCPPRVEPYPQQMHPPGFYWTTTTPCTSCTSCR